MYRERNERERRVSTEKKKQTSERGENATNQSQSTLTAYLKSIKRDEERERERKLAFLKGEEKRRSRDLK